ncbi:MAG TPA: hypothetical protein VFR56_08110, partial [Actinomycetes bacterium]|nr:hypothetical protein [Actinomycetes bacterium]
MRCHDRAQGDQPVTDVAGHQAPARADPAQLPADGPGAVDAEQDLAAHRRHQPAGQGDRGVLGPAAVGQLGVALGGVQRLGLPLEVVEEVEEPLVPTHAVEPVTPAACGGVLVNTAKVTLTGANESKRKV